MVECGLAPNQVGMVMLHPGSLAPGASLVPWLADYNRCKALVALLYRVEAGRNAASLACGSKPV